MVLRVNLISGPVTELILTTDIRDSKTLNILAFMLFLNGQIRNRKPQAPHLTLELINAVARRLAMLQAQTVHLTACVHIISV